MASMAALRIIDANYNRAAEGLRVVEEYARFVLEDAFLCGELKRLRHQLASVVEAIPRQDRLASRDTPGDVGTSIGTASEYARADVAAVAAANTERVEQALRALEEYAKVVAPPAVAAQFESLRYRVYTLQRAWLNLELARTCLQDARLYVLIDGRGSELEFESLVRALVDAGVHLVQLRDKSLDDRTLLGRARLLRRLTAATATRFIMNDRPDLAALAHADGVHVGQEELPVHEVRQIVGPRMLIGVSTHSLEQARAAVLDGASYIGCGPTFPSATKSFAGFPGLEFLIQVRREITLPAFAIGGIDEGNLPQVLATGCQRIAVSHAVCRAPDPGRAAERLLRSLTANGVRLPEPYSK